MARRIDMARVRPLCGGAAARRGDRVRSREVCFAKNTAVETGEWVANRAVQLFGGMGYMAESEVERQYRDMRILGIGGGTTEILTLLGRKDIGIPVVTTLKSTVDPASPGFTEAAEVMATKLAELDAEHAKALAGGGPRACGPPSWPRQAHRARERVEAAAGSRRTVPGAEPAGRVGQRFHRGRQRRLRDRRRRRRRVPDRGQ